MPPLSCRRLALAAPLIALLLPAVPASATDLLTAEEFDAYTMGKTLSYSWQGQEFGKEQYLPGHQVIWAFSGDECRRGTWYEDAGNICFVYEDDAEPKCWTFKQGPNGLLAKFLGDPDGTELSEVAQSSTPLSCAGPDVGV